MRIVISLLFAVCFVFFYTKPPSYTPSKNGVILLCAVVDYNIAPRNTLVDSGGLVPISITRLSNSIKSLVVEAYIPKTITSLRPLKFKGLCSCGGIGDR